MSWQEGNQSRSDLKLRSNKELLKIEGFLEEREAKLALYEFLRNNTTFATDLLLGVKLFPFQHMAIKSMFETDYFLGVWSRGMSKSFTTGIFAALDAVLNQGVEIGILSKSFRQAKMIFKKIEDRKRKFAGIGLMLIIMVSLGAVFLDSGIKTITTDEPAVDFRDIGTDFVTYYWPALILMGLILAGSVTGALVLARREDVENDQRVS